MKNFLENLFLRHYHGHLVNQFAVIPTRRKLDVDDTYTGRGIRIAFLDSGFYPHPDFASRVVEYHDISGEGSPFSAKSTVEGFHWHGTQTVASCAGDGFLSGEIYSGLASDAELVLVKVSENGGRITDTNIERGLEWILKNHERLGIQVLNLSFGGDCDLSTAESRVNLLAEEIVKSGIVVTVAAGNSEYERSIPPASSPSVITVGGFSDENQLNGNGHTLYHSSYGATADGIIKPEIVAPAMYVAAPILPGTLEFDIAEALSEINSSPDYELMEVALRNREAAGLPADVGERSVEELREIIRTRLIEHKVVSTHYQHVDGTSFAAPIVASVAALMIEANPNIAPATLKNILISTASRVTGFPAVRQGYGVINPNLAIEKARSETRHFKEESFAPPHVSKGRIIFNYHDDSAVSVSLVGDFNGWDSGQTLFNKNRHGIWTASIPCQPSGTYRYKYLVDGERWIEDPSHGFKEDDGLGGFNSILKVSCPETMK